MSTGLPATKAGLPWAPAGTLTTMTVPPPGEPIPVDPPPDPLEPSVPGRPPDPVDRIHWRDERITEQPHGPRA
jgi:hypothetical protein